MSSSGEELLRTHEALTCFQVMTFHFDTIKWRQYSKCTSQTAYVSWDDVTGVGHSFLSFYAELLNTALSYNSKLFMRSSLSCFVFNWWNVSSSVQWWTAGIHSRAAGSLVHMLFWFPELSDSIMNICPYWHPSRMRQFFLFYFHFECFLALIKFWEAHRVWRF